MSVGSFSFQAWRNSIKYSSRIDAILIFEENLKTLYFLSKLFYSTVLNDSQKLRFHTV